MEFWCIDEVVLAPPHGCCSAGAFGFPARLCPAQICEGAGTGGFGPSTTPCANSSGCIGEVGPKQTCGAGRVKFGPVQYLASVASALARSIEDSQ
eukprot:g47241.t1